LQIKSVLAFCLCLFGTIINVCNGQQPKLVLPIGHTGVVASAHFSPDCKIVLTNGTDNTAKIWDVNTGNLLANLKGHTLTVNDAEFSPVTKEDFDGGDNIVTASLDSTAKVWNAKNGTVIATLQGHKDEVTKASFSPDGKMILTCSPDRTAIIWDALTGKIINRLIGHNDEVISAEFSLANTEDPEGGSKVITASADKTVKIWSTQTGKLLFDLTEFKEGVSFASFSPNGEKIVTVSWDHSIKLWNALDGKRIADFIGHSNDINSCVFSPNGKKILTSSDDKTAKVWDANTGKKLLDLQGHTAEVSDARFSLYGEMIATASWDRTAKTWDAETGQMLEDFQGHTNLINTVVFSDDDRKLVTSSYDRSAKIWDVSSGKLLVDLKGHTEEIPLFQVSPSIEGEENRLATAAATTGSVKLWDLHSGKLLFDLRGHSDVVFSIQFSPDGKNIVTASKDSTSKVWDVETGKLLMTLGGHRAAVNYAEFSPSILRDSLAGNMIVSASDDGSAILWDAQIGKQLNKFTGHNGALTSAVFSQDGKRILTASIDKTAKLWDSKSGELLTTLSGNKESVTAARFSPDGKRIVTATYDGNAKLWDAESGKWLSDLKGRTSENNYVYFQFSHDGKKVITTSLDGNNIWSTNTGEWLAELNGHDEQSVYAEFSGNDKKIVTASDDYTAKVWDAANGKVLTDLKGHLFYVNQAQFISDKAGDGKYIITSSSDNTLKKWDAENGQLIYTFFALDSTDYFLQIPSGYYQGTPNASKLLYYITKDLKMISFEQLDVKYNRPDLVFEAIGNTDTTIIQTYRNAYYKRIKKLGIDTTAFRDGYAVPETDFFLLSTGAYVQKDQFMKIRLTAKDSSYELDRYNIWVNEVPVYGQRGISIRSRNTRNLDEDVSIILSEGINRIEVSVTNVNGIESYRELKMLKYEPIEPAQTITRFIGIGIDQFKDTSYNLNYSVKDIRDLSAKLKKQYGDDIIIDTLFNQNVTVSNINALKQKLLQTTVNDKVIISYSGHGLLSKDFDYFLSTYSINFDKPAENGLPYDELESLLDSIPARKKLMLIDACHSGEVDKEEFQQVKISQSTLAANHVVSKGGEIAESEEGSQKLGLKNSFELMQNLFVNVGKSTGATIISAAAGTEFALENGNLKNGVFTYCIMEAMDKYPTMKVSELKKIVGARVQELTNGMQKPTSRNEAIAVDWDVW
jgi:WD40 repeat protein